jgi:hypothetical protein
LVVAVKTWTDYFVAVCLSYNRKNENIGMPDSTKCGMAERIETDVQERIPGSTGSKYPAEDENGSRAFWPKAGIAEKNPPIKNYLGLI